MILEIQHWPGLMHGNSTWHVLADESSVPLDIFCYNQVTGKA